MAQDEGPIDQTGDQPAPLEAQGNQGDQQQADTPTLDAAPKKKPPNPPSDIEYERWWKTWRTMGEPRGHVRLAKLVRANIHRVRHAVLVGWPEQEMPAFKDRTLVAEREGQAAVQRITQQAEAQALEAVAKGLVGSYTDAAKAALSGMQDLGRAIQALAAQIAQAAASASFVTYRRVPDLGPDGQPRRDAKGNVITWLRPHVSAISAVQASRVLANAAKDHAALSKALLSSLAPDERPAVMAGPPSLLVVMPENDDLQVPAGHEPPTPPKSEAG